MGAAGYLDGGYGGCGGGGHMYIGKLMLMLVLPG
jgi:DUF917 family protein